jgi:hypothetical protein
MIPKIIHYCWFGRNPLPKSAVKCINSWRKFFPDYEIKEWNEDNFDVNSIPYTAEAYQARKYAFVSDYARFWILYHFGGIYFDTDVEVIKPMDDIIERGPFMGIEVVGTEIFESYPLVNPGLGLGAEPGLSFYKKVKDYYESIHFVNDAGIISGGTVVKHTTGLLLDFGLSPGDIFQQIEGISIFPSDFFNPFDDLTGKLRITDNTRSIHWYAATWQRRKPLIRWLSRMSHRVFGLYLHRKIHRIK